MYFNKSVWIFLRSCRYIIKKPFFLVLAFPLALFGSSYQGFEFFRLHILGQVMLLPTQFKLLYLLWEIFSWVVSLLLGSIIFPSFIILIAEYEKNPKTINMKRIWTKVTEAAYTFIIFLFTYYNFLFIVAGGGFLVAIAALVNNIFYAKTVYTIYDITGNTPLVATFITLAIMASMIISLLFTFISQIVVLENKGLIMSIIDGMKLLNRELPFILSAWIILNVCMLIPLFFLTVLLQALSLLASQNIFFSQFGFYIGGLVFLIIYTPIVAVTNVFWTELFLDIKGKLNLHKEVD